MNAELGHYMVNSNTYKTIIKAMWPFFHQIASKNEKKSESQN